MRTFFFLTVLLILAEQSRQGHATAPITTPSHTHLVTSPSNKIANNKDLIVTSDSNAYCTQLNRHLTKRLSGKPQIPPNISEDITHLQKDGIDLCSHEHVRAGIERLRRAFFILKHSKDLQQ